MSSVTPESTPYTMKICPIGDLIIHLPDLSIRFLVSSTILIMHSPVFSAMLGPSSQFAEAVAFRRQPAHAEPYVMELHDDDPVALAVVLRALHLLVAGIPRTINIRQLARIAVICDKYDCAEALRMWADIWVAPYSPYKAQLPTHESLMLFVSWLWGYEDIFKDIANNFTENIVVIEGEDGNMKKKWRWGQMLWEFDQHIPEFIIGRLPGIPLD
jgi:hypothetical protein